MLDDDEFVDYVLATFKECDIVQVADGHHLFKGITRRLQRRDAKWVMAKQREQDHKRLAKTGLLMPAQSRFASTLLRDPLLSLPLNDKERLTHDGQPAPSSYTQRLDRRSTKDPKGPLGDEEPGFPGVSIKLAQREAKRKWEEVTKALQPPTQPDWRAAAADVLSTLPT